MDRTDWERSKALFHGALDLPVERRAAYLDAECEGNRDLRQAVDALLANDAAVGGFMEQPAAGFAVVGTLPPTSPEPEPFAPGRLEIGGAGSPNAQPLELLPFLRRRLRILAVIELSAFGFFYAGRFLRLDFTSSVIWRIMIPGAVFLAFIAGFVALLSRATPYTLRQLRTLEAVLFGTVTVFYLNETYTTMFVEPGWLVIYAQRHPAEMSILARQAGIIWLAQLIAYGTFIPNTGRRSAVVTGLMALALVSTLAAAGVIHHIPPAALGLYLTETAMWMAVAIAIAVYGSQKISSLREEALAARKLGQYQLKRPLGRGGMGEVYLAEHVLLRRPCAVKIIRPEQTGDTRTLHRFLREVQAASTLTHPNTIQVFDYGQAADGTMFYAMEYLTGPNLEEFVKRHGPLPAGRAIFLLRQLCGALGEAHAIGLIHRDIKPSNVILCSRGGMHDVVKLLDFGLVRMQALDAAGGRLTQAGAIFGTPDYMSPEQAAGADALDSRSDIYSLGGLAAFLLTGEPPFVRPTVVQTLAAHINEPAASLLTRVPSVPDDLDRVVLRCLRKQADERFADMAALETALATCAAAGEWTHADAAAWSAA